MVSELQLVLFKTLHMILPATTDPRLKQQDEETEMNLDLNQGDNDENAKYEKDEDESEPENFSEDMD